MAWLGTWTKRRAITISSANIDNNLTHFPLPIFVNATAGTGNTDITDIFTEITTNELKLAVTKSDGTTQIYVEIDTWDNGTTKGILWVSKSDLTLSSSGNTTLYIYYDSAQADNSAYVAVQGSRTEVFDSDFQAVYHASEASGARTDSTSNNNDLTDNNTVSSGTGQIGRGANFELSNSEYLNRPHANLSAGFPTKVSTDFTFSLWINLETNSINQELIASDNISINRNFGWLILSTNEIRMIFLDSAGNSTSVDTTNASLTLGLVKIVVTVDISQKAAGIITYKNAVVLTDTTNSNNATTLNTSAVPFVLGSRQTGNVYNNFFDGVMDEIKISSAVRSPAWGKVEYNSDIDNLMSFGAVENYSGGGANTSDFFQLF